MPTSTHTMTDLDDARQALVAERQAALAELETLQVRRTDATTRPTDLEQVFEQLHSGRARTTDAEQARALEQTLAKVDAGLKLVDGQAAVLRLHARPAEIAAPLKVLRTDVGEALQALHVLLAACRRVKRTVRPVEAVNDRADVDRGMVLRAGLTADVPPPVMTLELGVANRLAALAGDGINRTSWDALLADAADCGLLKR
jgi:hypothetical protein